ncbi:MAG TPA: hypothetical protein VGI20_00445 [Rhizomicrobium sp.]
MTLNPITSLQRGAIVAAILWTGWMIWWSGSPASADITILSICGVAFGYVWYVPMRFVLAHMRPAPRDSDDGVKETRLSRLYVWTVWAGLMALTGIATACLLDLVSPLIPSGDWHWLISSLFVIVVWPTLMWSLRPLMKRHLPA